MGLYSCLFKVCPKKIILWVLKYWIIDSINNIMLIGDLNVNFYVVDIPSPVCGFILFYYRPGTVINQCTWQQIPSNIFIPTIPLVTIRLAHLNKKNYLFYLNIFKTLLFQYINNIIRKIRLQSSCIKSMQKLPRNVKLKIEALRFTSSPIWEYIHGWYFVCKHKWSTFSCKYGLVLLNLHIES